MSDSRAAGSNGQSQYGLDADLRAANSDTWGRRNTSTAASEDGPSTAVTQDHWILDADRSSCKRCHRGFSGAMSRKHHCRKCGEIFCGPCSAYNRRLSPQAELDPVGVECRVCFDCNSIQAGSGMLAKDRIGMRKDLMEDFKAERLKGAQETKHQDELLNKLVWLRNKMTVARVSPKDVSEKSKEPALRHPDVPWQTKDLDRCSQPECGGSLGMLTRKHHCRLTGEICCEKCSAKTRLDIWAGEDDDGSFSVDDDQSEGEHGTIWVSANCGEELDKSRGERPLLTGALLLLGQLSLGLGP
jgi:hypothetical protein